MTFDETMALLYLGKRLFPRDKSLDKFGANVWPTVKLRQFSPAYVSCSSVPGSVTGQDPFRSGPQFEPPLPAGQPGKVVGLVIDPDGAPVPGASVLVAGGKKGVVTDADGKFVLEVPSGTRLSISCIGYVTVEVTAMSVIRVRLEEDDTTLDEMVVVGYGAGRKNSLGLRGVRMMSKSADRAIAEEEISIQRGAELLNCPYQKLVNMCSYHEV